jgi:hypothetical protein
MRLSHISLQIVTLRDSAYVVDGWVVWPELEPNLGTWWADDQLPVAHERTARIVAKAVFSLA